jgi:hypothetical protein
MMMLVLNMIPAPLYMGVFSLLKNKKESKKKE